MTEGILYSPIDSQEIRDMIEDDSKDEIEALAKSGNADAQCGLGFLIVTENSENSENTEFYDDAVVWFQKAADQGNANGEYLLGLIQMYRYDVSVNDQDNEDDPTYADKAVEMIKKSSDQGNVKAIYQMGNMFERGYHFISIDLNEAKKWYEMGVARNCKMSIEASKRIGDVDGGV